MPAPLPLTRRRALTLGLGAAAAGCAPAPAPPDLVTLYRDVADRPFRNPVVAVPGLLGSRLVDRESGIVVWGGERGLSADPADPDALRAAALPLAPPGVALRDVRDGVRTEGVVRFARPLIFGLSLDVDVYGGLIRTLIAGGYDFRETRAEEIAEREVNLDAFEFPYDWRRDVVEAAQDLDAFLRRKAMQVQAERLRVLGDAGPPVRFDLVAHSMGCLVTRYYLMYGAAELPPGDAPPPLTWAGAEMVDTAVFVAPPFAGSITAIQDLVQGRSLGPLQPYYPPAMLGTYPSFYQLIPRDRHGRVTAAGAPLGPLLDPETWAREGWGLLDPGQDAVLAQLMPDAPDPAARRARARAHLEACLDRAGRLQRALDQPNAPPPGLELFLVLGGGFMTSASVRWSRERRAMEVDSVEAGDGVVLRASALADERPAGDRFERGQPWSPHAYRSTLLLPVEHVDITLDPVFGDNLLFWLVEGERATVRLRVPEGGPGGPTRRMIDALTR